MALGLCCKFDRMKLLDYLGVDDIFLKFVSILIIIEQQPQLVINECVVNVAPNP